MRLIFDTTLDDGRAEEVREVEPQHGSKRSFETLRTNGPVYHLMPDGTLTLGSRKVGSTTRNFGRNVRIEE